MRVAAGEADAPLKAVANLVGGFKDGEPVADTPYDDFMAMFELNLRPTYLVTQTALPRLVAEGGFTVPGQDPEETELAAS